VQITPILIRLALNFPPSFVNAGWSRTAMRYYYNKTAKKIQEKFANIVKK
jgi:hypothetical protein